VARPADGTARAALLASAREQFARHGYDEARVEEIARGAGLAKGSFYLHFPSKEACFLELVHQLFATIDLLLADSARRFGRLIGQLLAEPPALATFGATLRAERIAEHRQLLQLIWDWRDVVGLLVNGGTGARFGYLVEGMAQRIMETEGRTIRLQQQCGLLRDDVEPIVFLRLVSGGFLGLAQELLLLREPPDLDRWAASLADLLAGGMDGPGPARLELLRPLVASAAPRGAAPSAPPRRPMAPPPAPTVGAGARGAASVLPLLALLLAGASGLPGCSSEAQSHQVPDKGAPTAPALAAPVPVLARTPLPEAHRPSFAVSGTLRPAADVPLGFKVGGTLSRVLVERGQVVERGQALLQLDPGDHAATLAQAAAAVAAAQSQEALAADAATRVERLVASGTVSEQQAMQARLQLQAARAQLAQARAAHQAANLASSYTTLRAPFKGTVLGAPDAPGIVVGPGTPLIQLADLSCLRLSTTLPPEAAGRVAVGSPVALTGRGGQQAQATVVRLLPAFDPRTHRLPVEAELCEAAAAGWANAFVEAVFVGGTTTPAWRIPVTALLREGEQGVFVVGADGRAVWRPASILARGGGTVLVAGLADGERVVDLPPPDLRTGDLLRLLESTAPAGAPAP
jgi:RND family efflux transporter MFP subunit